MENTSTRKFSEDGYIDICKYSNRNWGFKQHVIIRLVETLISTCIQYAGFVWINKRSVTETEQVWYKIIKSAIGAVFNVQQTSAEIVVGLPPILITSKINSIKHFLKLNISKHQDDPLEALVQYESEISRHNPMVSKIKEVWKFLRWKVTKHPEEVDTTDKKIIMNNEYTRFLQLSPECCSYSKSQMKDFTEVVWQTQVTIRYQLDGYSCPPQVSCKKLSIPRSTTREVETLVMSIFFQNNLFNSFLHKYNSKLFTSASCICNTNSDQTAMHLLTSCSNVNSAKHQQMIELLDTLNVAPGTEDHVLLLNSSRNPEFIKLATNIMSECQHFLRTEIKLPSPQKIAATDDPT